eukprot:EG_transcript_16737
MWGPPLPAWQRPLSALLGLADYGYLAHRALRKPAGRFFPQGFGDIRLLLACRAEVEAALEGRAALAAVAPARVAGAAPLDVGRRGRFPLEVYRFEAPLGRFLPPESGAGTAHVLLPPAGQPVLGAAVVLAATGDQGFSFRKALVARPLAQRGIAAVLLENPIYGRRRPKGQVAFYPADVSTYLRATLAGMWEAHSWARWATERWQRPCVVTGMSYGAAQALGAAVLGARAGVSTQRIGAVAYLGSESASVLVSGFLRGDVDVDALGKDAAAVVEHFPEWKGLSALETVQRALQASGLTSLRPEAASAPPAVWLVNAAHDKFVRPEEARHLQACLARVPGEAAVRWVPGGHLSSIALAPHLLVPRIAEA